MKKIFIMLFILMLLFTVTSCNNNNNSLTSDTLNVKKIENIKKDFIFGVDASSVIALENSGVKYYDYEGNEKDVFETLSKSNINYIRVRVWNNPFDSNNNGYGGGNNTIETALAIGKRATKYNMKLLVDFHYSDFWADPSSQKAPKAWVDLTLEQKAKALYEYTKESLSLLKDNNIEVGIVQMGNETNGMLCGENDFKNMATLWQNAYKAIKEVYEKALTAIHFANPEREGLYEYYASLLEKHNVNYDIFGSSYYPYWHGTINNLTTVLNKIGKKYNKKVMIMETSYLYTNEDSDFFANTVSKNSAYVTFKYPISIQGQADFLVDLIDAINKVESAIGICYWEGTWISVGKFSYEENKILWEKYGSGWASSYSAEYDPDNAGKYYGGCGVDNQALFDKNGKPLESLKVFSLIKNGNIVKK